MSEERPYLQIPLPSEEEHRLFEEWVRRENKDDDNQDENEHIIIIDM